MSGVVIVGASSAGLYAAELLAKGGKQVILLERAALISPPERTYIITPKLLKVIPDFPSHLIRHRVEIFQLQVGQENAEIQLSAPDLVIDRRELIVELARRAEDAGVDIRLGHEFQGFSVQDGKPLLKVAGGDEVYDLQAQQVIGADGANSEVRKALSLEMPMSVPLLQAIVKLPSGCDDRISRVWFDPEQTPYFFWLIPDQERTGVVGLISETGADIRELLDSFLLQQGFQAGEYQVGVASMHQKGSQTTYQVGSLPVSLVGDAAGQVKVTTVGGTVTGLAAAKSLAEGILAGQQASHSHRSVNQELDLHLFIRNLLNRMTPTDYQHLIGSISQPVKEFLAQRDRDSMGLHFWKLVVLQPRFIPLGLRLLFRTVGMGR